MRNFLVHSFFLLAFLLLPPASFAQTSVLPAVETGSSHHTGDTADDSAIWIHPTDPSQSIIIGDDKNGGMMVWDLSGAEIQYIDAAKRLNNVDIRYNFPLTGSYSTGQSHSRVALVVVGNENGSSLATYKVNPTTRRLESTGDVPLSTSAPYGGCMYHSPVTRKYYYFVNWKSGVWQQVELSDAGNGNVTGQVVRSHDAGGQTEGCVADDVHKLYYIGEEAAGVWRYGAEPGDGTVRIQVDNTGSGGRLTADVEGISMYYKSDGTGYLIVSSQGNSTFQVYQRVSGGGANPFIGEFKVGANGSIDSTSGTDGLDVTNFPLGSTFPQGLLVVHDASNTGASSSNHKLVPFQRVATALGLALDTTWDPRLVGNGQNPTLPPPTVTSQQPTATIPPSPSPTSPLPTITSSTNSTPTPTITNVPDQPTNTPVPTQPSANPCSTISSLSCFFQWINEYIGIYLTKFADLNNDTNINLIDFEVWRRAAQTEFPSPTLFIPTPTIDLVLSPTPTQSINPSPTPSDIIPTPTSQPTGPTPTPPPITSGQGIWISPQRLASLPTSGSAWNNLKSAADSSTGTPDLSNQDDLTNVYIMAKALVYARTGQTNYRSDVLSALSYIANSGQYSGRALALGRELAAYVISADLINLKSADSSLDSKFRAKIRELLTTSTSGGPGNLVECQERRPNNWGTQCGSSRAAVAAYLGDTQELARTAQVFKGWLGDRTSYSGFTYGDLSWQCDPSKPVGINPKGCIKQGHNIDGVLPDDQRRGGSFSWPPPKENYVYSGLQGALSQAVILYNAGYDTWNWEDKALLRAFQWLHSEANFPAVGDDTWQPHITNFYYGTNFPAPIPSNAGKNVGWTDWTHSP